MLPTQSEALLNCHHMLHFVTSDVRYCLALEGIERIIPLVALQRLPASPDYLCGLLNLHGQPIPAIDVNLLLNLNNPQTYDLESSIIICHTEPKFGLVVPHVLGVIDFDIQTCYQHNDEQSGSGPIIATIIENNEIVYVLNIRWIEQKVSLQLENQSPIMQQ